ncbi:MAG TPA: hypothetical protein GX701_06405 [Clostridiales bacterium]|jgi:hypothetical protein|nr:hypothetical protein [Clostridiales bacterium]
MKKWVWAAPALVFLVSLGLVLYLRAKDVSPALLISSVEPQPWASLSETDVVTLLEQNLPAFEAAALGGELPEGVIERTEGGVLILERRPGGFVQALLAEGAVSPEHEKAINAKTTQRALPVAGWTYVLSYDIPLAQSHRYAAVVSARLADRQPLAKPTEEWVFLLAEKEGLAEPASYSKSAYVVKVFVPMQDGSVVTGFVDPKNYFFLGFAE